MAAFDNKWQLAISRLLFRRFPLNIYYYDGMALIVDHGAGDAPGIHDVLVRDMYRDRLRGAVLRGPLNVIDLGANAGSFGILLQKLGLQISKLVAVELNPVTYQRAAFNLTRNIKGVVIPLQAAVVGTARILNIRLGTGSTSDSIQGSEGGDGSMVAIAGITLDDLICEHFGDAIVDLMKMDIEGAEYEIFASESHHRITQCRYVLIEIHQDRGGEPESVKERLRDLNFELVPTTSTADADVTMWKNLSLAPQT